MPAGIDVQVFYLTIIWGVRAIAAAGALMIAYGIGVLSGMRTGKNER